VRISAVSLLLGSLLAAAPAQAAILVVDTTGDGVDIAPGDGVCRAGGPPPRCTLRAAIMEANALAGFDTINFNIAPAGAKTISPTSVLPNITTRVTIDGTTQPGWVAAPIVELNGTSVLVNTSALTLTGAGSSFSTIRGLVIDQFPGTGAAIRVLAGSSNNVIVGNYLGTDPTGTLARGNAVGVFIQGTAVNPASNNRIGGTTAAERNIISGNRVDGIQINGAGATGNLVQGNYIGLDVTGTVALGNTNQGVAIFGGGPGSPTNNTVGGIVAGAGNVISGNGNIGITISVAGTTGNRVEGNFIGTNAAGTAAIGNFRGIDIGASASGNFIGGTPAGAANRIAYNLDAGVTLVAAAGTGNQISSNEIYLNGALGIDLSDNGVTLNDVGDGDGGANNLQNFPVLSAAMSNGLGSANIAGSLNSAASTTYRIEFFASSAADPTGFGEGQRYLGFTNVTTNAAGNAIIGVTLATSLTAGEFVTATATDPSNNTSEFSAALVAVGYLVVTTTADTVDGNTTSTSALVATPGADGRISLREAILATNALPASPDTIGFGIPLTDANHRYYQNDLIPGSLSLVAPTTLADGAITDFDPDYPAGLTRSWYRIQPTSALPIVSDVLVLDGASQPGFVVGGPVIELDGSLIGSPVDGLQLSAGSSTVKALVINSFQRDGLRLSGPGGCVITGNYVGTNAAGTAAMANGVDGIHIQSSNNTVGGTTAAARNVVSGNADDGIEIIGAAPTANMIQGNYVGLNAAGTAAVGNGNDGIVIWLSRNNTIGGTAAGAGNVVGGNQSGFYFGDVTATGNAILGNFIGTNATGTAAVGNITGIYLDSASTTVGGTTAGARNLISGNTWAGLWIAGANGVVVQGNYVGTAADGTTALPNNFGVYLNAGANNNTIGGSAVGAANRIARNSNDGVVLVATAGAGNQIISNEIYSNGGLGIDLNDDGVSANDALDTDVGPNSLLNFPFTTAALESGGTLTVYFRLDLPAGSYRIEFFKNPSGADPSGNGEGQVFASSTNITHPGGGLTNFNHSFPGAVGDVITATTTLCTDGAPCATFGDTSEFGNAITAVPTAVKLTLFTAVAVDRAVELCWRTSSELANLGFHLYRSLSAFGPYERITEAVIPGLGSSPVGASYSYRDRGLTNGVQYFYQLEDIETTGRKGLHGPVSATPEEGDAPPEEGDESAASARIRYGDPSKVSLRVVERGVSGALIELVTGGFFATPQNDGTVRLEVPGFEELALPGSPALPVKRTWLEALAGRGVRMASARALELTGFTGLRPVNAGSPEMVASREGTVRVGARKVRAARSAAGVFPSSGARVVETAFQGEVKKALVELSPLRWDGGSGQLLLAQRLLVQVSFAGVETSERALGGSRGRRHREEKSHTGRTVLARLSTSRAGLYRVPFEEIFDARRQALPADSLRLSRLGESVAFHLEPSGTSFGPGSALYFVSPGEALNPYANQAVYELEWGSAGKLMTVRTARPQGFPIGSYQRRVEVEENRYYQAGLLRAPSLWLWDVLLSPALKGYPFTLSQLVDSPAKLEVWLQGGSDFEAVPDHHVRLSVNGVAVGEASWDGKTAKTLAVGVAPGVLREGENELGIESVGDTAASYSMVFLDRFAVTYARRAVAEAGVLEGSFLESGTVEVGALGEGSLVIETSAEPAWLGAMPTAGGVSFRVEPGRSYLAVSPGAVLRATVTKASASKLRSTRNRADYLIIAPREFLPAAEPLLERRRGQRLLSRAVAVEDVYEEFGYGEARPEAVKEFLEYAYHHWRSPSIRYVVLFGDATYDGKDYLGTGVVNRVPALTRKTSYLWTASDPGYAAVNGEDLLPDLAVGRLPAANLEQARLLVEKVLAYEESRQDLKGPAVLVADDPDLAGDFEADSEEIANSLVVREVERIYLRQLGAAGTRKAILGSLDRGASLMSYVGHGGIALWASENVFGSSDLESLSLQARQPILMTMNCLNGYFHFPYFDALGEAFLKAEGKGAIAAFSPSGLSLNAPAHLYHQALMKELTSGRHARLGDAVLGAQRTYAESGAFPELLAIYHLLGDPALELR